MVEFSQPTIWAWPLKEHVKEILFGGRYGYGKRVSELQFFYPQYAASFPIDKRTGMLGHLGFRAKTWLPDMKETMDSIARTLKIDCDKTEDGSDIDYYRVLVKKVAEAIHGQKDSFLKSFLLKRAEEKNIEIPYRLYYFIDWPELIVQLRPLYVVSAPLKSISEIIEDLIQRGRI